MLSGSEEFDPATLRGKLGIYFKGWEAEGLNQP